MYVCIYMYGECAMRCERCVLLGEAMQCHMIRDGVI